MAALALLNHEILRREMKARKLTEEALAEQLGITDRHLRNLLTKDTNSSCSLVYRISKVFGIPMEVLVEPKTTERS